jgi:hypothetical protein
LTSAVHGSAIAPPPVAPLEAYLRRSDWRLAVLVVTLVAVPGALDLFQAAPSERPRAGGAERVARSPGTQRTAAGRHVRPPRSC